MKNNIIFNLKWINNNYLIRVINALYFLLSEYIFMVLYLDKECISDNKDWTNPNSNKLFIIKSTLHTHANAGSNSFEFTGNINIDNNIINNLKWINFLFVTLLLMLTSMYN